MKSFTVAVVVVSLSFVLGCGGSGGKNAGGAGQTGQPPSQPSLASATVDAQRGGRIEVADPTSPYQGASIEIPAGALAQTTAITVQDGRGQANALEGELALKCGPEGTVFSIPARVTVPYTDALIQKYNTDPQNLLLFSEAADGTFKVILPTSIDASQKRVVAETSQFSVFSALSAALFPLYKQPPQLVDETPLDYEIQTAILPGGLSFSVIVFARGRSQSFISLGKGKLSDFWKSSNNVMIVHGLGASPATFSHNNQAQLNHNDFYWLFKNDPAFNTLYQNVIYVMYPSGRSVTKIWPQLAELIRQNAQPGFKTDVIAHSKGCILMRYGIETDKSVTHYFRKVFLLGAPNEGSNLQLLAAYFSVLPYYFPFSDLIIQGLLPGGTEVIDLSPLLSGLKSRYPGEKLPSTEYYLVATGADEIVPRTGAIPAWLNVPVNQIMDLDLPIHWELHGNAKNNNIAIQIRSWASGKDNQKPIIDVGQDQIVTVNALVTLSATASDPDFDTVTYQWRQNSGPTVTLANAATKVATFTPIQPGDYWFSFICDDGTGGTMSSVKVTVQAAIKSQTFFPQLDSFTTSNPNYNSMGPFDQWDWFAVGVDGNGIRFYPSLDFDISSAVPATAVIKSATLVLSIQQEVTSGEIEISDPQGKFPATFSSSTTSIDRTSHVQSVVSSGIVQLRLFSQIAPVAYVKYQSSEQSPANSPRLIIEWQ